MVGKADRRSADEPKGHNNGVRIRGGIRRPAGQGGAAMKQVKDLHQEAMRFVDEAEAARRQGQDLLARERLRQAFDCERRAADLVAGDRLLEPTRSVLHRSAATLALE